MVEQQMSHAVFWMMDKDLIQEASGLPGVALLDQGGGMIKQGLVGVGITHRALTLACFEHLHRCPSFG
jgi:hypothetical protein